MKLITAVFIGIISIQFLYIDKITSDFLRINKENMKLRNLPVKSIILNKTDGLSCEEICY